jgi:hypothetical protein
VPACFFAAQISLLVRVHACGTPADVRIRTLAEYTRENSNHFRSISRRCVAPILL